MKIKRFLDGDNMYLTRACLIIGGMTNSEGFFRQMKMIFRRRTGCTSRKISKVWREKTRCWAFRQFSNKPYKKKMPQMLQIALPLLVGLFLIIALFKFKAEAAAMPAQFEVIQGIPYCVTEDILYRYEDAGWSYAGYSEPIKQLTAGETLCAVDADGNVIFEGDLTFLEDMPLTSGYFVETAQNFIDLNQTIPFVEISGNIMFGPRALLKDGSILLPIGDHYKQYTMDEKPVALSDDFILTENGNVYQLSVVNSAEPDLRCIYDGGDITAISGSENTGQCLGITKSGGVISWNTTGYTNFNIPSISGWTDVVKVKQGFHFALALTKTGEVLYADCSKENTERIGNELGKWRDITNISISGMTVYGLKSDGSYLSMVIEL